ncbi:MAG: chitobiase/beta-hexosaminidase C-terminal domain-containing protein [Gammaproteobacteria bacterium]
MPDTASGGIPPLLSQTGAFAALRQLQPAKTLLPYDLVLAFWSDGAVKTRFAAIPEGKVAFSPTGDWTFPPGTVFVKTFELPTDATQPQQKRRLETRLLVMDRNGGVYGVTYKWRADLSDADLVPAEGLHEDIKVRDSAGTHVQSWYYPSREDCLVCHNSHTTGTLGPKTRQMNRDLHYADGVTENQLRRWNRLGLFDAALNESDIASFPTLARPDDATRSVEDRARSWLDSNCGHCHRPGGTVANFDARYETPLAQQHLVDGPVLIDQNVDRARVISPHDPWRSVALMRVDTNGEIRMPPLARNTIDTQGVALLRNWIESLPGRDVLSPPSLAPAGGSFDHPVSVTLASSVPGAEIRYTLDGSVPGPSDARYEKPIRIEGPVTLRARVYKEGFTRSVIAQQTYLVGQ